MSTQLLNQYDVKFIKEKEFGEIWHHASGGGMANFLDDIGYNTDGITEVLENVDFFYQWKYRNPNRNSRKRTYRF